MAVKAKKVKILRQKPALNMKLKCKLNRKNKKNKSVRNKNVLHERKNKNKKNMLASNRKWLKHKLEKKNITVKLMLLRKNNTQNKRMFSKSKT